MIGALRDPDIANLDRVQVIKGWLDANGETHERIYDVAWSDDRAVVNRRCERPVGSTVDVEDASYTNTIGDALLTAHWVDPDFDPKQRAFYYVRVTEIPKPRWTAYDAKFFNIKMPEGTAMTVQDRAYTSPIWYAPWAGLRSRRELARAFLPSARDSLAALGRGSARIRHWNHGSVLDHPRHREARGVRMSPESRRALEFRLRVALTLEAAALLSKWITHK